MTTVSPGVTDISWLTEARLLPMGSAMKRRVAMPVTIPGGMTNLVFPFPVASPNRTRWELRSA